MSFLKKLKILSRLNAIEAILASQDRQINVLGGAAADGVLALTEVREVRERIWPVFSQGAEENLKLIQKVAKLPD